MELGDKLVVIARWEGPESEEITLQDFTADGKSFIPVFSDEARFQAEILGSGFETQGVLIERTVLASILTGKEQLVLNPGSTRQPLSKTDIQAGHT